MRRSRRLPSTLALGLATLATAVPASSAEPAATVVGSLETVRPHDDPGGASAAVISAASNEFESFQVVVSGGSSGLEDVEIISPAGARELGLTARVGGLVFSTSRIPTESEERQASLAVGE